MYIFSRKKQNYHYCLIIIPSLEKLWAYFLLTVTNSPEILVLTIILKSEFLRVLELKEALVIVSSGDSQPLSMFPAWQEEYAWEWKPGKLETYTVPSNLVTTPPSL